MESLPLQTKLPLSFYKFLPELVPISLCLFGRLKLEPENYLVLGSLWRSEVHVEKLHCLPTTQVRHLLIELAGFEKSNATKWLQRLQNEEKTRTLGLSRQEMVDKFGKDVTGGDVTVLLPKGEEVVKTFVTEVDRICTRLVVGSPVLPPLLTVIGDTLHGWAKALIEATQRQSREEWEDHVFGADPRSTTSRRRRSRRVVGKRRGKH